MVLISTVHISHIIACYEVMARTSAQQKLGKRVREYRKKAGYTQEKVEELTGLDRSYISGVERGARNPSIKNITKLAKALKVKVSDLTDF